MSRVFAVIPAAGKSTRMGRPKLALPLGDRAVIERVIDALCQGGVEQILVVVAPHVPELMTLAQAAGADVLMLAGETPDMRATVEAGLHWLEDTFAPRPGDAWLLVPADHPVVDPLVVKRLLAMRKEHPGCSIVLPAYAGRRGHPTLIDWKHVEGMRALPVGQGFNSYLRARTEETCELLVDSPEVLLDLDTPADYRKLQELLERGERRAGWRYFWAVMVPLGLVPFLCCIGLEVVTRCMFVSVEAQKNLGAVVGLLAMFWLLLILGTLLDWSRRPRLPPDDEQS